MDLHAQLHDTQSSLAQHIDKTCVLEDAVIKEVEGLRGVVGRAGVGLIVRISIGIGRGMRRVRMMMRVHIIVPCELESVEGRMSNR